ncbi:hypothetical protein [Agarivorans sp. DSG3-1]|uniref:hypothetical protein n=1 Tax=Agarivorans sp. DSG3-1 TaxID=3342249 RepID=UPI00398F4381
MDQPLCILLTNYKRPQNIPNIINECLKVKNLEQLILIDNSKFGLAKQIDYQLPSEVVYMGDGINRGASYRFSIAASLRGKAVLCLDDDLFLSAEQIGLLQAKFTEQPNRMHGVWGQKVVTKYKQLVLAGGLYGQNTELDILNRVYMFSPYYAEQAQVFAKNLGFNSWSEIGPTDDILMSYSGGNKPLCHDVGAIQDCPSSNAPGVAVWMSKGFHKIRSQLVSRILEYKRKQPLES